MEIVITVLSFIGGLILVGVGFLLGCWHTNDKYKAQRRVDRPAEIHSAVKPEPVVHLRGVRGRGF